MILVIIITRFKSANRQLKMIRMNDNQIDYETINSIIS